MGKLLYDRKFFEGQADGSVRSARVILPIVLNQLELKIESFVDVGCGVGGWAAVAMNLGIKRVIGIDGNYVSPEQLKIPAQNFIPCNLSEEDIQLTETFDLCMSLEVAEHLPANRARAFVKSLTRLSNVVLFSAAVPHQGGTHHVNEQWQSYWVRLFNECGYGALDTVRPKVWGNKDVRSWYKQNCLIFIRGKGNDKPIEEYDVVHPDRYMTRIRKLTARKEARKALTIVPSTQAAVQTQIDTQFCFCIPLKPKSRSKDWASTENLLGQTLNSILRQTDPNFRVIIVGHDRPDLPQFNDTRVEFVTANIPVPLNGEEGKGDQVRKMHIAAGYAAQYGNSYIMVVDSDDLVDKRIVEFVRRDRHPVGYMVRAGYIYDTDTKNVGEFPDASMPAQLWNHCGTCAVFYFDASDLPQYSEGNVVSTKSFFQKLKGHRRWESKMMAAGRFPATIPFRAVLYRMNTGDNASYDYRRNDEFIDRLLSSSRNRPINVQTVADNFGI